MIKSERVLPVTGGSLALSMTESGQFDSCLHMSNGDLVAVLADKTLTDFRSTIAQQLRGQGWHGTPTVSLTKALSRFITWQVEPHKSVKGVQSRIDNVSVREKRLNAHFESKGKHATAQAVTKALNGDGSQLESLQEWESDCFAYAEFLAIVGELQKIQELLRELAPEAVGSPQAYPVLAECTEPESLKVPEQILCGAVSIKAPPAVPTDMTRTGYAVGCVA